MLEEILGIYVALEAYEDSRSALDVIDKDRNTTRKRLQIHIIELRE